MALPSARRLDRLFRPYALPGETPVRVWGTDLGSRASDPASHRGVVDAGPPRLLCLAGGPSALVVVRQTRDHRDDLDGFTVPWSLVVRFERESRLVRDEVTVEVAGRAPMRALVSNHFLLRHNRAAARALCDIARTSARRPAQAPQPLAPPPVPAAPESDTRPIPI
jgi:hypothetical protein